MKQLKNVSCQLRKTKTLMKTGANTYLKAKASGRRAWTILLSFCQAAVIIVYFGTGRLVRNWIISYWTDKIIVFIITISIKIIPRVCWSRSGIINPFHTKNKVLICHVCRRLVWLLQEFQQPLLQCTCKQGKEAGWERKKAKGCY